MLDQEGLLFDAEVAVSAAKLLVADRHVPVHVSRGAEPLAAGSAGLGRLLLLDLHVEAPDVSAQILDVVGREGAVVAPDIWFLAADSLVAQHVRPKLVTIAANRTLVLFLNVRIRVLGHGMDDEVALHAGLVIAEVAGEARLFAALESHVTAQSLDGPVDSVTSGTLVLQDDAALAALVVALVFGFLVLGCRIAR